MRFRASRPTLGRSGGTNPSTPTLSSPRAFIFHVSHLLHIVFHGVGQVLCWPYGGIHVRTAKNTQRQPQRIYRKDKRVDTGIYPLSLHDALPICEGKAGKILEEQDQNRKTYQGKQSST